MNSVTADNVEQVVFLLFGALYLIVPFLLVSHIVVSGVMR